ncbi:response regulator [Alsobacter sp. R-9]
MSSARRRHASNSPADLFGSGDTVAVHIVEDDPGVSDSLLTFLRGMGHVVHAYPDAESFFEAAPPRSDDIIIVDLLLPGISGAGVIRWLQEMKDPPRVIAITGQSQVAIAKQIRGLDGIELFRKPLSGEIIAQIV